MYGDLMGWGGGWGWGWFGIVVLAKWLFGGGGRSAESDRALTILRERYARGEIDKQEFDARKRDLGG